MMHTLWNFRLLLVSPVNQEYSRSLPTTRLPGTDPHDSHLDYFRIADNSEVDPPLRTEGVVIMLWPITDHSSAARVPDNDHPPL